MLTPKDLRARVVEAFEADVIGPLLPCRCTERDYGLIRVILEARRKNERGFGAAISSNAPHPPVPASSSTHRAPTIAEAHCRPSVPSPQLQPDPLMDICQRGARQRVRGPR